MIFMQCNNCALERGIGSHYRASTNLGPILHTWQCICWVSGLGYNPVKAGEQPSAGFFPPWLQKCLCASSCPMPSCMGSITRIQKSPVHSSFMTGMLTGKTIPFCGIGNIFIYLGENCLGAKVYPEHMNLPRWEENQQHSLRGMREDAPPQDWRLHMAHYWDNRETKR